MARKSDPLSRRWSAVIFECTSFELPRATNKTDNEENGRERYSTKVPFTLIHFVSVPLRPD